ncbi:MAG TPA: tripartite tricarboxylate transporter substrate binding protein [Rhodopila sp.]|nr:tripartite tricarboxylate transporter substrate binding protein [Rhodopila sp.]
MQRRTLLQGAMGALAVSRAAYADDYPSRPVTMIVPYGPGGGVSINARALQPYYEKTLGTRIIVENREGAGGITGYTVGAFAKPDGYTVTMISPAITASPWLVPNVRFTPEDYAYIGQVSFVPNMLVVNADSPFKTLKDLVEAMKAKPGEISTGIEASWPSSSVCGALFLAESGCKAKVVPGFKGGAEKIAAVLGGHLDFSVNNTQEVMPLFQAKRIRVLAMAAPQRSSFFPDVPTFREQGYDLTTGVWRSIAVPKATPQPVQDKLATALRQAMSDPALKQDFEKVELTVDYLDPAATRATIMAEYAEFDKLFTKLGMNVKHKA